MEKILQKRKRLIVPDISGQPEKYMNQDYLKKLARLTIEKGVSLQKDQIMVIRADAEMYPFVRMLTEEAYKAGAKEVIPLYSDTTAERLSCLYSPDEVFEKAPQWKVELLNGAAREGACFLSLVGTDPDAMKGVPAARPARNSLNLRKAANVYRNGIDKGELAWCIVPCATKAWAQKVYPDLSEEEAVEALWSDLFAVCRIDDSDPLENWGRHNASFEKKLEKLNQAGFEKLHYTSSNGTDLWVELPKGYRFEGGSSTLKNGRENFCNIPTEEVFTAPSKYGVNGTLHAVLPLNHNGSLIENFSFEFKDGKAVSWQAETGKEQLDAILNTDEGSAYLGEAALVPFDSPIRKRGKIFYETLLDENASCHFAFGQSYGETIEGGLEMSEDELLDCGMNQSAVHVDFMVGSSDLKIDGYTKSGEVIPVFENGVFSSWFDLSK